MSRTKNDYNKCRKCNKRFLTSELIIRVKNNNRGYRYFCVDCNKITDEYNSLQSLKKLLERQSNREKTDFKSMNKKQLITQCISLTHNFKRTCDTIIKLRIENRYLSKRLIKCDYQYRKMLGIKDGDDINGNDN